MTTKLVLAALLAGLLATGCETQSCTAIGCGAAFQVEFQRDGWPAGDYEITVVADGETIECSVTMPLQCDAPSPCPESSQVILGREGCALEPSAQKLNYVEFSPGKTPKSVTVKVQQDDALLGEGVYAPAYSESQPNGPDCEPTCKSAESAVLALTK